MNFLELLKNKGVVLLDGAMGTQLDRRGLMGRASCNLDAPQAVGEGLRAYAQSGCDALTTNTLTMNRLYIETHNVGVSVQDVNRAGVELARQAARGGQSASGKNFKEGILGSRRNTNFISSTSRRLAARRDLDMPCEFLPNPNGGIWRNNMPSLKFFPEAQSVLGDMSSAGQLMEPYGTFKESLFYDAFREQAQVLADAGADGLIIETMFDLREALVALRACKDVSSLPTIVSIAFQTDKDGGRTMMGDTAEQCARQLADAGADVVGANCGDLDPLQMANVVAALKVTTDRPVLAQPNAGRPRLEGDKTVFNMEPTPFAEGIAECIRAGAGIVGGCCGTTPAHIEAVRRRIDRR